MKKNILIIFSGIIICIISLAAIVSSNGKEGYTGSPGEGTCTSCHNTYFANSGGGAIVISSNIPITGYELNTTYQISVSISQVGKSLFGFDFEALYGTTTLDNAGTFTITNANETQLKTKVVNSIARNNVVNIKDAGISADTKTFTFDWTSPATNVGDITFYASGNAANGNGNQSGDYIYTTSNIISPLGGSTALDLNKKNKIQVEYISKLSILNVEFYSSNSNNVFGKIYTIQGKYIETILNEVPTNGIIKNQYYIKSNLKSGIYIFEITQNDKKYSSKFKIN